MKREIALFTGCTDLLCGKSNIPSNCIREVEVANLYSCSRYSIILL